MASRIGRMETIDELIRAREAELLPDDALEISVVRAQSQDLSLELRVFGPKLLILRNQAGAMAGQAHQVAGSIRTAQTVECEGREQDRED
jgi:hypothetical protein